jgi:type IV pilus assembly protein PilC
MPTFQYEAMDKTGKEIRDTIEAEDQDKAQETIKKQGYFITKIALKKARKGAAEKKAGANKGKSFSMGGVNSKTLTTFTRQLSILQEAGLPILRSLKILEHQAKPGALKNSLIDVCEEIEGGATLSEAMAKSPKAFNRLYVNMIKAGEAGGALEVILKRLAEFQERAQSLKRKVRGAMVYPIFVVTFAVSILFFIMLKIVPNFQKIFKDFGMKLPALTELLINISQKVQDYWYLLPGFPIGYWLYLKLLRRFGPGRTGWDYLKIKVPIFGQLIEKDIVARTMRTLGTLVASGVPILESLHITRETSGNAAFETMFGQVNEAIREGESIAKPMKESSLVLKNKAAMPALAMLGLMIFPIGYVIAFAIAYTAPGCNFGFAPGTAMFLLIPCIVIGAIVSALITAMMAYRLRHPILDDMVVNMVDVGEETGELDTMLYKVADTYDEEVAVLTESLTALMEPLLIITLGGIVGFIVIALFMPLIDMIQNLSSGK